MRVTGKAAACSVAASIFALGCGMMPVSGEETRVLPELVSEASGLQDVSGNVASWRIEASALPETDRYRYKYVLKNKGDGRILLDLSEGRSVRSKLEGLMDDLSLGLAPRESKTVQFSASGSPEPLIAPVRVGVWNQETGMWTFLAAGKASLYVPSPP